MTATLLLDIDITRLDFLVCTPHLAAEAKGNSETLRNTTMTTYYAGWAITGIKSLPDWTRNGF
jgi:hypothetical protein